MHKQPNKKENNKDRSHTGAYLLPARTPTKKQKRLHWYMAYCCRCVEQGIITKHSMRLRVLSLERCVKQCWAYLQPNAVRCHQPASDARAAPSESDS